MFPYYEFEDVTKAIFKFWLSADYDVIEYLPALLQNCAGVVSAQTIWPTEAPYPYDAYLNIVCDPLCVTRIKNMLEVMAIGGIE